MTREDAIYWIKNLAVLATEKDMPQIEEALNMAIESLADRKAELEKRVEWLELQMRLVHRTLDKIDRKTEPNSSEKPNNCDTCKHNKLEWFSETCDGCSKAHSNYEPKDEPQTEVVMPKKCKGCDSASKIIEAYSRGFKDGADAVKAMPQTDCAWK